MKRWRYRPYDDTTVDRLQAEHRLPRLVAILLAQRDITSVEQAQHFLHADLSHLHDPLRMLGMRTAVERLRRAIANSERILIYGDYDVDGTTAVVILRTAIEMAGGKAEFHVPHRLHDGYGMRTGVIERASRDGVGLIISVDTGIRETAVVERARELGIDTIITDHHLPEAGVPRALAVLNPNQPGCSYPDKGLSGVGVAFKLSQALLAGLGWTPERLRRVLESMLKVVAIGTIADVVPLIGENRIFARIGLAGLARSANPGLKALLEVSDLSQKRRLSASDVAFRLAPRLNAAGRMDTAGEVIELFTTRDPARAGEIAQKLDRLNSDRQQTEAAVVREILERLGAAVAPAEMPCIVVEGEGWHAGVIGIVASRIVEHFHRPTIVLSTNTEEGTATGSGRSIPGFHLLEALEHVHDVFERFGGHRQAAGCRLAVGRIGELRERLSRYAAAVLKAEDFVPVVELDADLEFRFISDQMMAELARLEPHGFGNPRPLFSAQGLRLKTAPELLKEKHLKLRIEQGKVSFSAVGWRMAARANGLALGSEIHAAFSVEPDYYWGGWRLELEDFHLASAAAGS
jgi:single-stranded-DNA-specific exonuclease